MPAKRRYNVKGTNDFLVLAGIFFFLCLWAVKDAWYPSDKVLKKHPRAAAIAFESGGTVDKIHVSEGDQVNEKQVLAVLRSDRISVKYEATKAEYTAANKQFNEIQAACRKAEKDGANEAELAKQLESMEAVRSKVEEFKATLDELHASLNAAELIVPEKGRVKEIRIHPHQLVRIIKAEADGQVSIGENGAVSLVSEGSTNSIEIADHMKLAVEAGETIQRGDVIAGEIVMTFVPSHSTHFFVFNKSLAIFSFIAFWVFLAIHILAR